MLSRIAAAGLNGTDGYIVICEADVSSGMPQFNMIGALAPEVREAQDRVRTAIRNSGFQLSGEKVTVNMSPADMRKEGTGYDLPIAVALLFSYGLLSPQGNMKDTILNNSVFIGELSLSGELLPVRGILSLVSAAKDAGYKQVFMPKDNAAEGAAIDGICSYGIGSLMEMSEIISGRIPIPPRTVYVDNYDRYVEDKDFSDVLGQELVKYATIIAVAGRHNLLYIGPAGTGKSMLASRIPGIMPKMTREERLEVSKLYSVSGLLSAEEPLLNSRPFRSPHHTISQYALSGGGTVPKPGEISLANGGVLFMDELAEFKPAVIDSLRQPMETKMVTVSRVHSSVEYPADFVLVAATNPCKCGYYPDRSRCSCTEISVRNYLGKISKPVLDRIDICVETFIPKYSELKTGSKGQTSSEIRRRIEQLRTVQSVRLSPFGIMYNSEMNPEQIEMFCRLSDKDNEFVRSIYEKKGMSARGLHKVLKVARTIADYKGHSNIEHEDISEAVSFRNIEDKYWRGGRENSGRYAAAYMC